MFCGRKKAQNSFPPKLNWKTLANCVEKHLNSQTETMESEAPTSEFGYGKYLIVPFWYASAAYQARLVSPWPTARNIAFTAHQMYGERFCKGHLCTLLMRFDAHQRSSLNVPWPPTSKAVKAVFTHL